MEDTRSRSGSAETKAGRVTSRTLCAASGKFGILLVALVALMASTPLIITGPVRNGVLTLFTGAVLIAGLHAARPGIRLLAIGLALAMADFAIGRCAAALRLKRNGSS
jgi:hypothetical protein